MKSITRTFICTVTVAAIALSSGAAALTASAEWHKNEDGYYYTLEDGDRLTGWQKIGDGKYYFGSDGIAVTGFKKIKGKTYYFDPKKKGRMATGFKTISGNIYYFGTNGVMRTGWQTIDGKKYYFSSSGKAATGKVKIGGKTYTFSSKGVLQENTESSSSGSTSVFSKSTLGKASFGMTSAQVVKANKLKTYINVGELDGYHGIICMPTSYLGYKSEEILVLFLFDKSDELIAVRAIVLDANAAYAWKKYAVGKYGAAVAEKDGTALYGDEETMDVIFLSIDDEAVIITEMNAEDLETVLDALDDVMAAIAENY